jgi:hypothetical protein
MHKTIRSLTLPLVLLAALIAIPSKAVASDGTLLGFGDDLNRVTQAAPGIAGVSQVARIMVDFEGVSESGWGEVDAAVGAARASGQALMFTVTGLRAPDLVAWQAFLGELRTRYPDLWAVQAWNEPNLAAIAAT